MRNRLLVALWMLLCAATPATAQISVAIGFPHVSIGINLPLYPELVPVPGYPVYYAPGLNSNYFFYDGMYWVYQEDNWYASSWYNGPWALTTPEYVPVFILRVPVRYYRQPPRYFSGWRSDAPPRWGEHWGNDWEQRRSGWDRWNRDAAPAPAPLPLYQREYSGDRYPARVEQQQTLHSQHYRYEPRDPVVRQQYQTQRVQSAPAPAVQSAPSPAQRETREAPQRRNSGPQDTQRSNAPTAPPAQPPRREAEPAERSVPPQGPPPQRGQSMRQQDQQREREADRQQEPEPKSHGQETAPQNKEAAPEPGRGKGRGRARDREKADERDREQDRDHR